MNAIGLQVPMNDLKRRIAPLRGELDAAIGQILSRGSFILGESCAAFESAFAAYCGTRHCVGVANGTDALELALLALGIGAGARVGTVANAGMYSTTAILAAGARPVYIDVDPETLLMAAAKLEDAGPLDAVIVTHLYGQMADMPALIAAAGGKPVIEDCAQAHGAALGGRRAGSWGRLGAFSFYPTKNLGALGDGGAVTTDDADVAARLRQLRQYGWSRRYHAELPRGRNSRLDDMQAAALLVMLPHLDRWNERRRAIARAYAEALKSNRLAFTARERGPAYVGHLCVLRAAERDWVREGLARRGIASDIHYPTPDYRQPAVVSVLGAGRELPETEAATREILTLPCFPELADTEVEAVAAALRGIDGA
ncbi:MAG TPA: DegT/DnrJ/EryC1/StrS family aminotransferase [Dongiaceae bacterium]|nr:DegT/DnrJ/EryC1/StrS family aminotransferase [Dongiaceae bacterium]